MNNFYIYIYLDPRKPGKYEYGDYCFLYEPFYIGKGKGRRLNDNSHRSVYFKNKINKIRNCGLEPNVIKLFENITEEKSFILESDLINLVGRKDLDKGSLINFTDGGEGSTGWVCSEEVRKKHSKRMMGENNPMFGKCKKNSPVYGNHHSNKTRKYLSEINFGKNNPFYGKQHSKETKRKQSEMNRGENHKNHILTENNVIEIWKYLNEGKLNHREIANLFGVYRRTISAINTRQIWSHIGGSNEII